MNIKDYIKKRLSDEKYIMKWQYLILFGYYDRKDSVDILSIPIQYDMKNFTFDTEKNLNDVLNYINHYKVTIITDDNRVNDIKLMIDSKKTKWYIDGKPFEELFNDNRQ